ncbi:hypothetical protein [Pedobacter gandavensis]|uniref:Uncharacterized protein n=1 Tax=Pedobacter gandavensis TaxID=2679963 RepID=A0ABR6EU73_9SPHI|nr:hypothetical protein [Pedobacter gandavensis]MBB2148820.1 hypothetical protein [Pedobacter gandavensis]
MPAPHRSAKQAKEARLVIVGELYKKGYSFREIRDEVMTREGKETYSLQTVHKDVESLLKEWRKTRIDDVDMAIQLELAAIDDQLKELWNAWERSKTDHKLKSKKQSGIAIKEKGVSVITPGGEMKESEGKSKIIPRSIEQTEKDEINFGDPRYQDLINKLRMERRKLLGLYSVGPIDINLTGSVSIDKWLEDNNDEDDD